MLNHVKSSENFDDLPIFRSGASGLEESTPSSIPEMEAPNAELSCHGSFAPGFLSCTTLPRILGVDRFSYQTDKVPLLTEVLQTLLLAAQDQHLRLPQVGVRHGLCL